MRLKLITVCAFFLSAICARADDGYAGKAAPQNDAVPKAEAAPQTDDSGKSDAPKLEADPKSGNDEKSAKDSKETSAKEEGKSEGASSKNKSAKTLPKELESALVTITDDTGGATGFFAKIKDKTFVVTNFHVISACKVPQIRTLNGDDVQVSNKLFMANGYDIVIIPATLPDGCVTLEFPEDIRKVANNSDEIIVCGNSNNSGTMLPAFGKIVGIGPKLVETDCAIYRGNSGSPMYHIASGKVVGVLSHVQKMNKDDPIVEGGMKNNTSAIKEELRYFGQRFDTVKAWEAVSQDELSRQRQLLDSYSVKLDVYNAFFADANDFLRGDKVFGAANAHPDFNRIATRFLSGARNLNTYGGARNKIRLFFIDFERLLVQEMGALKSLKVASGFDDMKARYIGIYERRINECKNQKGGG